MHHLGLPTDGGFHGAVLEEKSFRKVARKLALSPARVSELVRNLETRVGVRPVERTSRSVTAGPAGQRRWAVHESASGPSCRFVTRPCRAAIWSRPDQHGGRYERRD